MTLGVHQVDGRIAANAAVKIRAALKKSVDARKVITDYAQEKSLLITRLPIQLSQIALLKTALAHARGLNIMSL